MAHRFGSRRLGVLAAAIGLATGLAGTAGAADVCIKYYIPYLKFSLTIVGKGFRVPSKGRCKPFFGYSMEGGVTGSACTSSDGSKANFTLTQIVGSTGETSFFHVALPLPLGDLAGAEFSHQFLDGSFDSIWLEDVGLCSYDVP